MAYLVSTFPGLDLREFRRSLVGRRQLRQALLGFLDALGVGIVRGHVAVQLGSPVPLHEVLIVNPRGAEARLVTEAGVPLEATLEILSGPAILLVGAALIDVAELKGGVADLIALR